MAAVVHFGCPRLTFDHISGHFRSIRNFIFGHFGCSKFTFDGISGHFRWIRNFFLILFYEMAAGAHFGCPKFTFDRISGYFRSICNFNFCLIFFTKWPPAPSLDVVRRKSHIGWNWSTDFFCRLIRVYIGLRQYVSEGVQNFVHWHFFKSNMAAATAKYH